MIELFISARKLRSVTLSDVTGFLGQKSVAGGGKYGGIRGGGRVGHRRFRQMT